MKFARIEHLELPDTGAPLRGVGKNKQNPTTTQAIQPKVMLRRRKQAGYIYPSALVT